MIAQELLALMVLLALTVWVVFIVAVLLGKLGCCATWKMHVLRSLVTWTQFAILVQSTVATLAHVQRATRVSTVQRTLTNANKVCTHSVGILTCYKVILKSMPLCTSLFI